MYNEVTLYEGEIDMSLAISEHLYLLKQHTPVSSASFDLLDYVTFGFFDGVVLLPNEIERKDYFDFDYDAFRLTSYDDLIENQKATHIKRPDMKDPNSPYCVITMLQLLPFCNERCNNKMTQYELLKYVAEAFETATNICTGNNNNYSNAKISFYPYFSYGQVDIVLIIQGNSLVYIYNVIERFMHNTRYMDECYGISIPEVSCSKQVCFTSSYSVCGILSATKIMMKKYDCNSTNEFYHKVAEHVDPVDYCSDNMFFIYETYVKNSSGAMTSLADCLHDRLKANSWGLVGNHDYGYSVKLDKVEQLREMMILTASVCCCNPNIAGTSLHVHVKTEKDPNNEYSIPEDVATHTGQIERRDNRRFERLFWSMHNLDKVSADLSITDAKQKLMNDLFDLSVVDHSWHTKEWRTLALNIDEMYEFCYQLANSHFSSGIGTMLIQPFNRLYEIYENAFSYLLELPSGDDDESLIDPLEKNELSDFMNSLDKALSALMLSTNSILETRDFHSNELNSHSKYLVAYYVFMMMALNQILKLNSSSETDVYDIEVLISVTNSLNMSCRQILGKYTDVDFYGEPTSLYILSIPMHYLKDTSAMFPMLLHEAGHMKGNVPENSIRKKYMDKLLAESLAAAVFPEGIIARDSNCKIDMLESFGFQASIDGKGVVIKSSLFPEQSERINGIAKEVAENAYALILEESNKVMKQNMEKKFQIDSKEFENNLRIDYYEDLLLDGRFFADLIEGNIQDHIEDKEETYYDFAKKIIKNCNIDLLNKLMNLLPGKMHYPLEEAKHRIDKYSVTINVNRRSTFRYSAFGDKMNYEEFCWEMMRAANEVFADIIMLKCLGIDANGDPADYLRCFSDQGLTECSLNLANAFRIFSILKAYFNLEDSMIVNCIYERVKAIDGCNKVFLQNPAKYSICFSKEVLTDYEISAEQLFLPIFCDYIRALKQSFPCFDKNEEPFSYLKDGDSFNNGLDVYSLWRDLNRVRGGKA